MAANGDHKPQRSGIAKCQYNLYRYQHRRCRMYKEYNHQRDRKNTTYHDYCRIAFCLCVPGC